VLAASRLVLPAHSNRTHTDLAPHLQVNEIVRTPLGVRVSVIGVK
jgi:hypothetical protein